VDGIHLKAAINAMTTPGKIYKLIIFCSNEQLSTFKDVLHTLVSSFLSAIASALMLFFFLYHSLFDIFLVELWKCDDPSLDDEV